MSNTKSEIPILLVEDSMIMRQLVQNILGELGYTNIAAAPNGKAALEKVRASKKTGLYKIVFLDWGMPEMDGLSFLKECRADRDMDNMAIVMVTAVSDQKCIITAMECGVTAYITKPFTPDVVKEKIRQVSDWLEKTQA